MLRNEAGELRAQWRLAAMAAGCLALAAAARLGTSALLSALFRAWNLNADTVARAPGWARLLYGWQGSLTTLIVDAVTLLCVVRACRVKPPRFDWRRFWRCWAVGVGIALVSAALFLMTDSLRLQWPLDRPRVSAALAPLCALSLVTVLAEELFTKGLLYDAVERHWGAMPAVAASALAFFMLNGGWSGSAVSGLNVALMGALCACLHRRFGLWAPVGLRWGWSISSVFLLGNGGGAHAVYRLYGVSETLLTGGDGGLVYGLWLTLALSVLLIVVVRNMKDNTGRIQ